MATSSPLHSDGSASRQPSSHSQHGITASNAALPSRKVEGLVGPLRPLSGIRSCGRPPRPPSLPFAHALRAAIKTKMGARGRSLRVRPCHRICEVTTMRRTAGRENKIGTRVERREKGSASAAPLPERTRIKKSNVKRQRDSARQWTNVQTPLSHALQMHRSCVDSVGMKRAKRPAVNP